MRSAAHSGNALSQLLLSLWERSSSDAVNAGRAVKRKRLCCSFRLCYSSRTRVRRVISGSSHRLVFALRRRLRRRRRCRFVRYKFKTKRTRELFLEQQQLKLNWVNWKSFKNPNAAAVNDDVFVHVRSPTKSNKSQIINIFSLLAAVRVFLLRLHLLLLLHSTDKNKTAQPAFACVRVCVLECLCMCVFALSENICLEIC